jgi:hypothetical protein
VKRFLRLEFDMFDPRYPENEPGARHRAPNRPPARLNTKSVMWSMAAGMFAAIVILVLTYVLRANGIA